MRRLRARDRASRIALRMPMLCRLMVIGCWNWSMSRLMRNCPAVTSWKVILLWYMPSASPSRPCLGRWPDSARMRLSGL
ncbi:hypothetical protein D3C71_1461810 [compost metagenome]